MGELAKLRQFIVCVLLLGLCAYTVRLNQQLYLNHVQLNQMHLEIAQLKKVAHNSSEVKHLQKKLEYASDILMRQQDQIDLLIMNKKKWGD